GRNLGRSLHDWRSRRKGQSPPGPQAQSEVSTVVSCRLKPAAAHGSSRQPTTGNRQLLLLVIVEKQEKIGVVIHAEEGLGLLHRLTGVILEHQANITSVAIIDNRPPDARIYFEIELPAEPSQLTADLQKLPVVRSVEVVKSLERIYGKRIIIMGGGAQVGQVAIGAVSEADRHNIRGEHISVDTIPLVGEQSLADAVRAVARLPRVKALVLAGALMGGDIEQAVREVRQTGLLVISLNMAGSVPDAADLV